MAKKQGFPYAKPQKISGVLPVPSNAFGGGGSGGSTADAETLTSMGTLITSGASKATPVDSDEFAIRNSVGGLMAKVTWANIKATLLTTWKDVTGGLVGMTLYKINFKNAANTFTSFFTNANTAARTYTFQDRDGTIADNTDLALKMALAGSETITGQKTIGLDGIALILQNATGGATPTAQYIRFKDSAGTTKFNFGYESATTEFYMENAISGGVTRIYNNGIECINLTTAGVVSLPTGQLKFPATQNASADANTLDDYEEGTFTPAINFGGGTTGLTYTTQEGNYTKIGRKVTCNIKIRLSAKGSSTGDLYFTGLPFTVYYGNIEANAISIGLMENITRAGQIVGRGNGNATSAFLFDISILGVATQLDNTNLANNSYIELTLTYFV